MTRHRMLLLLTLLLGACPGPKSTDEPDLRPPPDFARPDQQVLVDLSVEPDLTPAPDLVPQCGYRQAYSIEQMACACDAQRGHSVACSATFCCSQGQTCLDGDRCSGPPERKLAAMAYDGRRGRVVLTGGDFYQSVAPAGDALRDDLWELDAVTWGPLMPSGMKPTPRHSAALAFDGVQTLLFGGGTRIPTQMHTPSGESWRWDGKTWTLLDPVMVPGPPARSGHAMAYDDARKRVVLFGGYGATDLLADTWEWNGTAWLQKTMVGTPPSKRNYHGMAYDAKRAKTVLFGGTTGVYAYNAETWTFDGTTWARLAPAMSPPPRSLFGMAYDSFRERIVIFGGETVGGIGSALSDTWEFDGTTWTRLTPAVSPPGRLGPAMVYDPVRKATLLYGGLSIAGNARSGDLWSWDGTTWKRLY